MTGPSVSVSRDVAHPPAHLYRILSDYRVHHPRIVPQPEFEAVVVEEGGVGKGTLIRVDLRVMGRARSFRMRVDEPAPGRVLTETDVATGDVTTFTVEALAGGARSRVTIATQWSAKKGMAGLLERLFNPGFARKLYARELAQLEAYAGTVPQEGISRG